MAGSKPKQLSLKLDALTNDVSEFRRDMVSFRGTAAARWAKTVRWAGTREDAWRKKGLISGEAFECAVLILSRKSGGTIAVGGEISSHLIALCHPDFDRRLRSEWSGALANVLKGRLTAEEAAERGVTAAAAQKKRTAAAKAQVQAREKLSSPEDDEESGGSALRSRGPIKPDVRTRTKS